MYGNELNTQTTVLTNIEQPTHVELPMIRTADLPSIIWIKLARLADPRAVARRYYMLIKGPVEAYAKENIQPSVE